MRNNIQKNEGTKGSKKILRAAGKIVGSITLGVLDILLGMAEGFALSMDKSELYRAVYGYRENEWTTEKISKFFDSLARRGYIEISRQGSTASVRFTNKTKLALLDKIAGKISVDDCLYFVSFDIPERLRRNRDLFRRAIKRLGFCELQKSLWVCNKNLGVYVELAMQEYNVSDYVVYLLCSASNVDNAIGKILKT